MKIQVETYVEPKSSEYRYWVCATDMWHKITRDGEVVVDQTVETGNRFLDVTKRIGSKEDLDDPYERIIGIRMYSELRKLLNLEHQEVVKIFGYYDSWCLGFIFIPVVLPGSGISILSMRSKDYGTRSYPTLCTTGKSQSPRYLPHGSNIRNAGGYY